MDHDFIQSRFGVGICLQQLRVAAATHEGFSQTSITWFWLSYGRSETSEWSRQP
jgi:hypothetical protein